MRGNEIKRLCKEIWETVRRGIRLSISGLWLGLNGMIYFGAKALYLRAMSRFSAAFLVLFPLISAGCSGSNALNVGTDRDAEPNGSYSGSTLNSPVTDQNPHPGGDSSYPSSVSDQGVVPPPPQKDDGR